MPSFLISQFFLDLSTPIFELVKNFLSCRYLLFEGVNSSWPVNTYFFNRPILLKPVDPTFLSCQIFLDLLIPTFWISQFFRDLSIPISESVNSFATCQYRPCSIFILDLNWYQLLRPPCLVFPFFMLLPIVFLFRFFFV